MLRIAGNPTGNTVPQKITKRLFAVQKIPPCWLGISPWLLMHWMAVDIFEDIHHGQLEPGKHSWNSFLLSKLLWEQPWIWNPCRHFSALGHPQGAVAAFRMLPDGYLQQHYMASPSQILWCATTAGGGLNIIAPATWKYYCIKNIFPAFLTVWLSVQCLEGWSC